MYELSLRSIRAKPVEISRTAVRRLAIRHSGLSDRENDLALSGKDAQEYAATVIENLGAVQIDTISVVERAHTHVLWSRDRRAVPSLFPALEAEPRRIFEYWSHAAAFLPVGHFRYCLPRMRRIEKNGHEWYRADAKITAHVLDRVRAEGPLMSKDFEEKKKRGPWWDWKPAKRSLEYLFHAGKIMVVTRPGFQKLYDLAERALPSASGESIPTDEELADYYLDRSIRSLGVFQAKDIAYGRKDGTGGMAGAIEKALRSGIIIEIRAEGNPDDPVYVSPDDLATIQDPDGTDEDGDSRRVRILSPFDPLLIDRKRTSRLFGIDFAIECYIPEEKRKFGYFALPVLFGDRIGAILDCKAERKEKKLTVKQARFMIPSKESGIADSIRTGKRGLSPYPAEWRAAFREELDAYAAFNGCDRVEWQ